MPRIRICHEAVEGVALMLGKRPQIRVIATARVPVVRIRRDGNVHPILCANAVGDFHEMAFVPVLSATLVYAFDRRRFTLGLAAAVLLACTKEDQFVVLAFNGAAMLLVAKGDAFERRFGRSVALVAAGGAAAYFGIVRNVLQPHIGYAALHFFNWSQAMPLPIGTLTLMRVRYALHILAPLAFVPLISRYALFLIPGIVEVMASHEPVTLAPGAHYSALLSGYALAAFVDGIGRLSNVRLRIGAGAGAAVLSILVAIFASPMEYWYYLYRFPDSEDASLQRAIDSFPPNANVGTEGEIFSHLGLDRNASIRLLGEQWILFDRDHYSAQWRFVDEPLVTKLVLGREYSVVRKNDDIELLQRQAGLCTLTVTGSCAAVSAPFILAFRDMTSDRTAR